MVFCKKVFKSPSLLLQLKPCKWIIKSPLSCGGGFCLATLATRCVGWVYCQRQCLNLKDNASKFVIASRQSRRSNLQKIQAKSLNFQQKAEFKGKIQQNA
ncbi:hypothetical protein DMC01_10095 [Campylobacter troglodytis]|nr:hypothetical protein DMC01_10095 [Campylobacter troglodytis]